MSTQPTALAETPVVTDADRAWAREQIAKHGPIPADLVDHINELRRRAASKTSPVSEQPTAVVRGRGRTGSGGLPPQPARSRSRNGSSAAGS